ncbi:MAG: DUF3817 domain-containing protein [Cyclobacteriaceae bacterium]|nr:DUF3817 domain-containing protein [Cyclobacteriaceae bacterium]
MNAVNRIKQLRWVAIAEGISFLVLLLIAMPLKYLYGIPEMVKVVGWAHGVLFIAYLVAVALAIKPMAWRITGIAGAVIASLLPFGTFVLDRSLKKKQLSLQQVENDSVRS